MEQKISIRATEPGDYPALAEVFNQPRVIWGTLQSPYTSVEARQKRLARLPESDRTIVAVLGVKASRIP